MFKKELDYCKYCYEEFKECNFSIDLWLRKGIDRKWERVNSEIFGSKRFFFPELELLARFYATEILGIEEMRYKEKIQSIKDNNRFINEIFFPMNNLILKIRVENAKNIYNNIKKNNWIYPEEYKENIHGVRDLVKTYATKVLRIDENDYYEEIKKSYIERGKNINITADEYILIERLSDYIGTMIEPVSYQMKVEEANKIIDELLRYTNNKNLFAVKRIIQNLLNKNEDEQTKIAVYISEFRFNDGYFEGILYKWLRFVMNLITVNSKKEDSRVEKDLLNDFLNSNIQNIDDLYLYCRKISISIADIEEALYKIKTIDIILYKKADEKLKQITNEKKESTNYTEDMKILGKKYYEYFKQTGYDDKRLYEIANKNINANQIRQYIKLYMINVLGLEERDFYYTIYKTSKKYITKTSVFFAELSDCQDNEDKLLNIIKKYFINYKSTILYQRLSEKVYPYALQRAGSRKEERDNLEKDLKRKLLKCKNVISKRRKEEKEAIKKTNESEQSIKAKAVIEEFLSSDMNLSDYLGTKGITTGEYNNYKRLIEENYPDLYEQLQSKNQQSSSRHFYTICNIGKNIIKEIINGIQIDQNNKRPFDLLDYYQKIKISPNELYRIIKSQLTPEETKAIRIFISKYKSDKGLNINQVINVKHTLMVNGKAKEISLQEKEEAIKYLKTNGLPLTNSLYNIVLKKLVQNQLEEIPKRK